MARVANEKIYWETHRACMVELLLFVHSYIFKLSYIIDSPHLYYDCRLLSSATANTPYANASPAT
jgi:hypothetical protein